MDASPPDPSADKTRQRLIDAAGEIFAEQGYRTATVRDICARAGANVAAVSYHFGDKEKLYAAVLRYAHGHAIAKYPPHMNLPPGAPPEARLHSFVLAFLHRLMDDGRPAWHAKMMSREIADPTAALDMLVDEQVKPLFGFVRQVMVDLLGPRVPDETVRLCCFSVVGQCLFYHFGQPVMRRLFPQRTIGVKDAPRVAEHITRLTLSGVREMAAKNASPKGGAK
jgi:TetR/AcrR family transcriptional regulator, regulator of cefoperazone and chloramphenicol sensitivity